MPDYTYGDYVYFKNMTDTPNEQWTAFRAGRGGGERVQEKGAMTLNANNGGGGRIEGKKKISRKLVETGGAGGLE